MYPYYFAWWRCFHIIEEVSLWQIPRKLWESCSRLWHWEVSLTPRLDNLLDPSRPLVSFEFILQLFCRFDFGLAVGYEFTERIWLVYRTGRQFSHLWALVLEANSGLVHIHLCLLSIAQHHCLWSFNLDRWSHAVSLAHHLSSTEQGAPTVAVPANDRQSLVHQGFIAFPLLY